MFEELGEQLNDSIRRTNAIYNTALPNKDIADIVYDPRGNSFLDKFPKIRIPESEEGTVNIAGGEEQTLLVHAKQRQVDVLAYDSNTEEISVERMLPMVSGGQLTEALYVAGAGEWMVQVYESGKVTVLGSGEHIKLCEFSLEGFKPIRVTINPNLSYIVCLHDDDGYAIVNLNTCSLLRRSSGRMVWKAYDEYLHFDEKKVELASLTGGALLSWEGEVVWERASFSRTKNLLAMVN